MLTRCHYMATSDIMHCNHGVLTMCDIMCRSWIHLVSWYRMWRFALKYWYLGRPIILVSQLRQTTKLQILGYTCVSWLERPGCVTVWRWWSIRAGDPLEDSGGVGLGVRMGLGLGLVGSLGLGWGDGLLFLWPPAITTTDWARQTRGLKWLAGDEVFDWCQHRVFHRCESFVHVMLRPHGHRRRLVKDEASAEASDISDTAPDEGEELPAGGHGSPEERTGEVAQAR